MYSWTQLCHTLKVFYKTVISSHEDHPPFTHDALQDGFVAVSLPKNQDKMYVRSVQVTTRIVKRSIFMNCFKSSIYSFLHC